MKHRNLFLTLGLLLSMAAVGSAQDEGTTPADPAKTQEELGQLRDYVTDAEGAVQTAISDVNSIKKIKLSGYVQARYEDHQQGFLPGDGKTKNQFTIRRARIKAAAKPKPNTGVTIQFDLGGTALSLKDAYVDWYPTAAEADSSWVFTAGQTKWPFGYQVVQSSSVRETPERAQFAKRYFDGERDRGLMVSTPLTFPVRAQFGLFNGVGANKNDNNNRKDFVGRVRTSPLGSLDLGASVYLGRQVTQQPASAVAATTGFVDANGNGVKDTGEQTVVVTTAKAAVPAVQGVKSRYGIDAQWVPFTGLNLKGEYVAGRDANAANLPIRSHAWYALASYSILPNTAVVGMFDRLREGANGTVTNNKDIWHVGVTRFLTDATRARVFYQFVNDHASVTGTKRNDNVLQAELITLF